MLAGYALELRKQNCRLMLAGVEDSARLKLERTGKLAIIGSDNVFEVSEHYDESVLKAHAEAEVWLNS